MDAEQLREHLAATPDLIRRHRARMMPGNVGYSDVPVFGGFGPSTPISVHALEMGDMEAAGVGTLARYCMAVGSIPPQPIRGFWWVNGECKGLGALGMDEDEFDLWGNPNGHDYLEPIRPTIAHLRAYAGEVVLTEGVEPILRAMEDVRWYSLKMFPNESEEWVSEEQAREISGRSERTLREWRNSGVVRHIKCGHGFEYSKEDLLTMMQVKMQNRNRGKTLPG
ncbi:helix-turn-helix domain-containing protein [Corynebacterium heidelbergense]|uniref:Helix-turn-helix domain-containing protein n=1 Tax=Corynebacterium heidelbergense TaxID=2055947 RepID=A0A364VE35_9CORY|nr:helix-turn-helix domain-containing protein [Corynebacterium heidelbergense]RAV34907.1 hypothetical protein CWC39_00785 [Corynebacterium heidelbergense]WCZ36043.1 hypothetical protein CHEID_02380 [Corynebacterium heidelbergense]